MKRCPHEDAQFCPLYVEAHNARGLGCDDGRLAEMGCAVDRGGVDYDTAAAEITRLRSRVSELEADWRETIRANAEEVLNLTAELNALRSAVRELREVVEWYGENARLCRIIHSEGDKGRNALDADGGSRARAVLLSTSSILDKDSAGSKSHD